MKGVGFDWPIGYEDLAPYYDKAERLHRRHRPARKDCAARPTASFRRRRRSSRTKHLVYRACEKLGHQGDQLAPGGDHEPAERAPGLHLLRQLRPRLHVPVELRVELRADFPGDGDRTRDGAGQLDGARAHHRRVGQGHGRVVHRQGDGRGTPGALPHRRAVGGGGRVGPAAAQLEIDGAIRTASATPAASSASTSPTPSASACPRPCRTCGACRRSRQRGYGAHLYIPWWMADRHNELDFPLGLSRRSGRRRVRHAGVGIRRWPTSKARATACR